MEPPKDNHSAPDGVSSQRWTNALLIVATLAAVSGILLLLLRPEPSPGIEISLPTPTPPPEHMVYLSGAIAQPGVYKCQQGDRLQDAIESAGGLVPDADPYALNMASLLKDQDHFHLPLIGETENSSDIPVTASESNENLTETEIPAPTSDNPIDINSASSDQLQLLPGIGPAKAEAIIQFRENYGLFADKSELTSVPGIGPATLQNLNDLITVTTPEP